MPDGAQIVGRQGEVFSMRVTIPADEDGFLGRTCPNCSQTFRIHSDDYQALPDEPMLWCVYCGHQADHSDFMTQQQRDRVMRAVGDLGQQLVQNILHDAFSGFSRSTPRSGVSIQVSNRSKPFFPRPLPGISEERLVRVRSCATCNLRYAVFGEHRYCPVCGPLPPAVVASDALAAEAARLDLLAELSTEATAELREHGVFSRIYVDTLENLVGIIETLAHNVFRSAATDAERRIRGRGNIFQRLDDTADLFLAAGCADLRTILGPAAWQRLQGTWAVRHAFTHNDGFVDERYLSRVPGAIVRRGERLVVSQQLCRQAIIDTAALCAALTGLIT